MRKILTLCCIAVLLLSLCPVALSETDKSAAPSAPTKHEAGGWQAFFIGCCYGLRVGTQWNDGVDLHWREWAQPVLGIWNGIDCYNGMTAHQWAEKNGANWY